MRITDWLTMIPAVQNGWTLAAFMAVLVAYVYLRLNTKK
jgi:hypothetical protein